MSDEPDERPMSFGDAVAAHLKDDPPRDPYYTVIRPGADLSSCSICGAAVPTRGFRVHDEFHRLQGLIP